MNLRSLPGLLLLIGVGFGCASSDGDSVNGNPIDARMSDEQIIAAFGMEIKSASSKFTQGPDGTQTDYTQGEQKVTVVRSIVTGVYVMSAGTIKGEWRLGGGQ